MGGIILSVAGTIGGLILLYLLLSNPQGVLAIAQSSGGFVIAESRVLQGR